MTIPRFAVKFAVPAAASALAALFLASCGSKDKVYKLALAAPLTGDIAAMGQGMKRGTEMAVEEANASGRFKYKIELAAFDDRADPKEAVNVANQIASDPAIFAVVGHLNSGCSIPAAQVYAKKNLPMLNPASTNPKLTQQQLEPSWTWPRNIFRVNATDDVQGRFAAQYLRKNLQLKTVAVIHDKTPYGQGLAEEFQKEFLAQGGKVLSFDGIAIGDKDFKSLLTRIKNGGPQAIYFGGIYNEGGLIAKQSRELGLNAVFMSGDGTQSPEFVKVAGSASEGAYLTNVGQPPERTPSAKTFVENFKAKYPDVDFQPYDQYAYEAARIALFALESTGAGLEPGKTDPLKAMAFLRTLKFDGVLGETRFDEKGDTLNKTISVYLVKDGKFVPQI